MKTFVNNSEIAKVLLCTFDLFKYLNTSISLNTSKNMRNFSDFRKVGITTSIVLKTAI